MKQPCVYLLVSKRNGTLHLGVTSNLVQQAWLLQLAESFPKTRLANCSNKEPTYRAGNGIDLGVLHFRENRQ